MPHKRAKRSLREAEDRKKGRDLAPGASTDPSNDSVSKRALWVLDAEKVRNDFRERKKRARDDGPGGEDDGSKSKKKKRQKTDSEKPNQNKPAGRSILPGESLGHFNKRIEAEFRPTVRAVIKSSRPENARIDLGKKKQAKDKDVEKEDDSENDGYKGHNDPSKKSISKTKTASEVPANDAKAPKPARKTEFATKATRTSLRDIAMAPPTLPTSQKRNKAIEAARNATTGADPSGEASPFGLSRGKAKDVISPAQKLALEREREMVVKRYRELKESKRKP